MFDTKIHNYSHYPRKSTKIHNYPQQREARQFHVSKDNAKSKHARNFHVSDVRHVRSFPNREKLRYKRHAFRSCSALFPFTKIDSGRQMYLEIKPRLSLQDLDHYAAFSLNLGRRRTGLMEKMAQTSTSTTKSLMSIPSGFNCWQTQDGQRLELMDSGKFEQQHFRWLTFSIYHFFRPLNYKVEGTLHDRRRNGTELKLTCRDNIITLDMRYTSGNNVTKVVFNPASLDREIERLLLNATKEVFDKSGLKDWTIVQSHKSESLISPEKHKIYLNCQHLLFYCKKYGIRDFVNIIKKRIAQFPSGMFPPSLSNTFTFSYTDTITVSSPPVRETGLEHLGIDF